MALNSSGPISLAGTTAGQSIELENGGNGTTQISLNDAAVRNLAGVASGAITMPTNFYGKSNITYYIAKTTRGNTGLGSTSDGSWNGIDSSGNFYSSGGTNYATGTIGAAGGIIKTNSTFTQTSAVRFNANCYNFEQSQAVYDPVSNGVIMAGLYAASFYWVVKFNSSLSVTANQRIGITLGAYSAGISSSQPMYAAGTDSSGNIYTVTNAKIVWYCSNWYYTLIVKMNSAMSAVSWAKYQGSAYSIQRPPRAASVSANGTVYILSQPDTSSRDCLSVFTSAGTLSFSIDVNDSNVSKWTSVISDSSGNIYLAGYNTAAATPSNAIVAKLNSSGVVQWARTVRKTFAGYTASIASINVGVDTSGNVYLNYFTSVTGNGTPAQLITTKFDSSGTSQWARYYAINLTGANMGFQNITQSYYSFNVASNGIPHQTIAYRHGSGYQYELFLMWPIDGSKAGTYTLAGGDFTETVTLGASDAIISTYSPSWTYTSYTTNAANTATITLNTYGYPNLSSTTSGATGVQTTTQVT